MSLLFVAFITNTALASSSAFVGDLGAHFFAKNNMDPMHGQTSPVESQDTAQSPASHNIQKPQVAEKNSNGAARTRFTLKPSNEARASFSKHLFSTPEFSTLKQSKIKVDTQMPADGSERGRFTLKPSKEARASFSKHLFSTSAYSAPKRDAVDLAERRAEYLAQRQEEVETILHRSKSDDSGKSGKVDELLSEMHAPTVGVFQGIIRLVILLAAVVSLASIAYSKCEVLSQMHEGKQGLQKLKAK